MKVITAKSAGFCFGVKRAVETVYNEIKAGGNIYTYGEIIHNEEVVKDLESKGVTVLHSREELEKLEEGTVIIRSHGVSKEIYDLIKLKKSIKLVDATCPFVVKIHNIVEEESKKGKKIVVIGDASHPEVQGIVGFSDSPVTVVQNKNEAEAFENDPAQEICIVSQTTFNYKKFAELVEIFGKKGYSINTVNTICSATEQRQTEAREIASTVDAMIVIGGKNSSNTRKLYEICSEMCRDTRLIQTLADLDSGFPESTSCVGITAGASTPNYIIEEVQSNVRGTDF
ncbi:4-hydroxy-3-methylbut-2-enyl diphosphate reductase [Lachnospiraceae bacterium KH1T2]|nr:4-hydroxy-3-methylbut-2-enyl diphosphate reductase [Lachnospiraceae bacterium KH1T2]